MTEPLLSDVGLIAMVPNDWCTYWQPRHQIVSRLARRFRTAWVTPGPFRGETRADRPHEGERAEPPPGMLVLDRRVGPVSPRGPAWLATRFMRRRVLRARRELLQHGCRTLLAQVWRPEFWPAVRPGDANVRVYYIDDEYSFRRDATPDPAEAAIIAAADLVFIHSRALLERKGGINPNTVFAPNGVDYARFATPVLEPAALADVPRPRIGYAGVLKATLDWPLLEALAARHPAWSFVFVGPVRAEPATHAALDRLRANGNVHILPPVPPAQLPGYVQHFDVGILPYSADSHSVRWGYPLKLHEYLAAGLPVVGNPLHALDEFPDVVTQCTGEEAWSAALAVALDPLADTPARRAARQAIARRHDWDALAGAVAAAMAATLGPDVAARLREAEERAGMHSAAVS